MFKDLTRIKLFLYLDVSLIEVLIIRT